MDPTPLLVFLIFSTSCVSGLHVPQPEKLMVDILDGEVIVFWKHPLDTPSDSWYNVQMAKYFGGWTMVDTCTRITNTFCDISSLIEDYRAGYKVKVQLVTGDDKSAWSMKKFLPSSSKLQPPSFSLWATSSTLTVYIHPKPILKKFFPFGLIHTIYLQERGQDNQENITTYLKDDMEEEYRMETFSSLRWGREYCVSVKVQGRGALYASGVSPKQCLQLPEQEWFITAMTSLSILAVLAFVTIMAAVLLCYLRRPEKTPAVLKSPVIGWFPLSVGEEKLEVVTDRGWLLTASRTEQPEDKGEDKGEDRRTSMDSGFTRESSSVENSTEGPTVTQEDSGCGSLGGAERSTLSQTDQPLQEGNTDSHVAQKMQTGGLDLGCLLHSSSVNPDGPDNGSIQETAAWDNYRSQSHSAVIQVCGHDEEFEQMLLDSVLAKVITGYSAGPQSCTCSGAGQCKWCRKEGSCGPDVIQSRIEDGAPRRTCDSLNSFKGITSQSQTDAFMIDDLEGNFPQLDGTFPLLAALTSLPLVEGVENFSMTNAPLSLSDVQLSSD